MLLDWLYFDGQYPCYNEARMKFGLLMSLACEALHRKE